MTPEDVKNRIGYCVVYDKREYVITGRTAKKTGGSGKLTIELQPKTMYLTSPTNGNYNTWLPENLLMFITGVDGKMVKIAQPTPVTSPPNEEVKLQ